MSQSKSQIKVDDNVKKLLGGLKISEPQNLVVLKDIILNYLTFCPYDKDTKIKADRLQWKRTASEIIRDGYVYTGKACSDLAIVYLALARAARRTGQLVKLISFEGQKTHTIVEIELDKGWYRLDPSAIDSQPFAGQLAADAIWNNKYKVWKKGRDLWDLGLAGIEAEAEMFNEN